MDSLYSFNRIRDKFYTLSAREQFLVVAVVGVAMYFVFESLVFGPQRDRRTQLLASQALTSTQVVALRAEILSVGKSDGVLEQEQAEHARLKKQMSILNAVLGSMQVSAPQVGELVKGVLKDYPRVALGSLKTLPVKTLLSAPQAKSDNQTKAQAPQKTIYKHGVELEIHGNYLDLLAYLKNLEASSKNVFWSDLKLMTVKYPETSLRVTIFILSDQPVLKIS
jgi:MSHA biogenesis protein MshJ